MMQYLVFLLVYVLGVLGYAATPVVGYPSGSSIKFIKQNLDLNGQAQILSGTTDPTSVATTGSPGSLYLNTSTGIVYRKTDSGSTTNWSSFSSGITPAQAGQLWSGYHDNTCSWARTNTAYGDPTADATCNLVQRQNVNMGTVTSYLSSTDKLPGIVFTPTATGQYYVCGTGKIVGSSLAAVLDIRLYDVTGSAELANYQESVFVGSNTQFAGLCAFLPLTANVAETVTLQTKSSAGSVTIQAGSTSLSSIEWTVLRVSQVSPFPLLSNSVTSGSSSAKLFEAALITNNGTTCAVSNQLGSSWVSSVASGGATQCNLTLSGSFSATPLCVCSTQGTVAAGYDTCEIQSVSTTAIVTRTGYGPNGEAVNINLMCLGPK